jgi:large subunit ribosomal protein L7/L12
LGYLKSEYDIDAPEGGTAVVETVTTVVEVVEQTSFDVHLKAIDPTKKIGIIKIVRAVTGLGLAESKALVEAAPTLVKEAMPKAEAEKLKKELEDTGAQVELK